MNLTKKKKAKEKQRLFYESPPALPSPPPGLAEDGQWVDGTVNSVTDNPQTKPWTSPYRNAFATIHFGPGDVAYFVPPHVLPPLWTASKTIHLTDVDPQTGHSIVHYLYKGVYETPITHDETLGTSEQDKLGAALLVFVASDAYELDGLKQLAQDEINRHSRVLNVFEILDVIDDDFSRLVPDSWVHQHLRLRANEAFAHDSTVFVDELFLQDLKNTDLIKFISRCVIGLYNTRLCQMLDGEKSTCREREPKEAKPEDLTLILNSPKLEYSAPVETALAEQFPTTPHRDIELEDLALSTINSSIISCPETEVPPPKVVVEQSWDTEPDLPQIGNIEKWYTCEPDPEPMPEPELADDIPNNPEPGVFEEAAEPAVDEQPAMPDTAASSEIVPMEAPDEKVVINRTRCPRQTRHLLRQGGWKKCRHCRVVVNSRTMQTS